MIVKLLKDSKFVEVNDSYAARLIEQGEAVVYEKTEAPKHEKAEEAEVPTEKTEGKKKKG